MLIKTNTAAAIPEYVLNGVLVLDSAQWDDATTPRTATPARFQHGHRYERSYFGTLLAVVPFARITR